VRAMSVNVPPMSTARRIDAAMPSRLEARCEAGLRQLMTDNQVYAELSRNSLGYVRQYHNKDEAAQKYEQALEEVLSHERIE